jgi:hypothetical protein
LLTREDDIDKEKSGNQIGCMRSNPCSEVGNKIDASQLGGAAHLMKASSKHEMIKSAAVMGRNGR